MKCKYYKNGVESVLYTELFGYMDNIAPQKKSVDAVYKILKSHGIATKKGGSIYLTQANVQASLREIENINNRYPGLIDTEYIKMTQENIYSKSAELHVVNINEDLLKRIVNEGGTNADLIYKTQNDLDTYVRTVAGLTAASQEDTRVTEAIRRENRNESKYSEQAREERAEVQKKSNHLKESFAKAGVSVDVVYDNQMDSLGSIEKSDDSNSPVVTFNTDLTTEDTVYHEFGHAYIDMLGADNPVIIQAFEELKDTELYNRVADKYPELEGERLDKEVLATAIGIEGAKITRKNPSPIQQMLNKIFRAFSKMLNKLGLVTTPNTAAILAQEMFAKDLRAGEMVNPISGYTQFQKKTRDQEKLEEITIQLKVKIKADLARIKKLPQEEQDVLLPKLEKLEASLIKVDRVEDFVKFVDATTATMLETKQQFNDIMNLTDENGNVDFKEQSSYKNLNLMYSMKVNLDGLDVLSDIKHLVKRKKRSGQVLSVGAFNTLEEKLNAVLEEVEELKEDFDYEVVPIIAESLLGFHNKNIDVELQSLIQNIQDNLKNGVIRSSMNMKEIKNTTEYKRAKRKFDNEEYTQEEFDAALANMQIESLKNKMIPHRSMLVKELREAQKDKSGFSYLMDPMIYSSESALQLFVKAVDEANLKSNDMTRDFKYILRDQYNEMAEGQNQFDIEGLNDPFLEEIEMTVRDDQYFSDKSQQKETSTIKVLTLVQPLLADQYYSDIRKEYARLAEQYNKPQRKDFNDQSDFKDANSKFYKSNNGKRYVADQAKFLNESTEPIEGWQDIRDSIQKQIKTAQSIIDSSNSTDVAVNQELKIKKLRSTLANNMLGKLPRGEWVKPKASKYANPKYAAIQNDPKKKKYYDFVLEEFQKGHKMVGTKRMEKNSWDNFSYLMPSIRKEGIDRVKEQGAYTAIKDKLEDSFSLTETADEMAIYDNATGELQSNIPVRYTNLVSSKDVSKDIASSLYRFRHMAHNFKTKSEIVGQVMLFRDIIEKRGTIEVDASGRAYVSSIAEKLGVKMPITKPGESYTYKHLNEWINMVMFGETSYRTDVNVFGKTINLEQAAGSINQYVAMNTLALNVLQGGNQFVLDNISLLGESVAGQFVTKSDLAWATQKYWGEGAALSDVGNFAPDTKLGKALEMFDALTEFTDREGNKLVGSKLRKALDTGNLMVLQQAVEHELASKRMLALMKNLEGKLKDKDGNVIMKDGEPANLYDMLEVDKKGFMSVNKKVANFNKSDFIHLLRGLGRRTNQTKGRFDSPILSKSWYGKMINLFRSWVVPGIRRRYGHGGFTGSTIHTDEEMGAVTQGMYISFFNLLSESVVGGLKSPLGVYNNMSLMEQQNVKRTMVELSSLIAAMALVAALSNLDDDEETYLSNFMLYQAKRYETEILQWTPIVGTKEAFRILKSPSATLRPFEQAGSLIENIGNELMHAIGIPIANKKIFYQRNTGRFKKGDRKIRKDVEDLMPVLRGLRTTQSPKEKYQWFLNL
tara:strand:+ start:8440 stop:12924 length:4485 start_codon:yes stop_codon:yes gene_type:complete